jgi:hypothetical protein
MVLAHKLQEVGFDVHSHELLHFVVESELGLGPSSSDNCRDVARLR